MEGKALYCDCGCGQIMAMDLGNRIEIKARVHGRTHNLTIHKLISSKDPEYVKAMEDRMKGSSN